MRNRTGLVALIVLAVATLLMVFFVLPNMNRDKPAETPAATGADATQPAGGETKTADGKQARGTQADDATVEGGATTPEAASSENNATTEAAGTDATATADGATAGKAATETADTSPATPEDADTIPAFDLLRVEPDGSTVIAGHAQPNTKIDIRNGDTVIATADVGPTGDFAAVLDQPLAAGDYQLTLTARDDKGASRTSEEVATVSVPKDASGDLLAMVSKPGEASRLITIPESEEGMNAKQTADASAGEAAVPATGEIATDQTTPPQPAAGETASNVAPAAGGTAAPAETAAAANANAPVRVAAVELEGDRIFVAGNTRPGALVRIYADDKLIGERKADAEGRYVVDGVIDLSVGRHAIRADVMSADGSKVELRASVPFDRPEGEQIAVVAQDGNASQTSPALGLVGGGTFDKLRDEAGMALGLLKGLFANGGTPSAEELAAARSATEIALKSLAEFKPGIEEGAVANEMAGRASVAAAAALAKLQALPQEAESLRGSLGAIEASVSAALTPALEADDNLPAQTPAAGSTAPAVAETATPAPAEGNAATENKDASAAVEPDAAAKPAAEAKTAAADEPETVEQAPLKQSKTSVIIRRGDTLWQISRRIYGKGVRYTTIYLANQAQIANPDLIIPGQIFGVPDAASESDADAEALHRKHVHGD